MGAEIVGVSVVIPAYNAVGTIEETLESVVRQTLQPLEVIVVDDGSTDNTAELAASFSGRLPNLQIIRKANGGVSETRNAAIRASRGDLIAPLDADDLWHPTYLQRMTSRLAERPQSGFVYSFLRRIDLDSRISGRDVPYGVDGWGFYQMLARNFVGCGSNAIYRREAIEAAGLFEPRLVGSEDFLLQSIVCWSAPVTHVPQHLVAYRNTPNSLSKRWFDIVEADKLMARVLTERLPLIKPAGLRWMNAARLHKHLIAHRIAGTAVGVGPTLLQLRAVALDPHRYLQDEFGQLALRMRRKRRKGGKGSKANRSGVARHSLKGALFADIDPNDQFRAGQHPVWERRMAHARQLDAEHARMLELSPEIAVVRATARR